MATYSAQTSSKPILQALIWSAEPNEDYDDPLKPRPHGWRLLVEHEVAEHPDNPLRMTWMATLSEVLEQMNYYWPEPPVWRRKDTSEAVDLGRLTGVEWEKEELD